MIRSRMNSSKEVNHKTEITTMRPTQSTASTEVLQAFVGALQSLNPEYLQELQASLKNVNISMPTDERTSSMKSKELFVSQKHQSKIEQGKGADRRWHTYIKVDGRNKLIAKTNRDDLIEFLYSYYAGIENGDARSFKTLFQKFLEYKKEMVSSNTIYKYEQDYIRFFSETKFENRPFEEITKNECQIFLRQQITKLDLRKRAYEALYSYLDNTFEYAVDEGLLEHNPMDKVKRRDLFKFCNNPRVDAKKRTVSDAELAQINARIMEDHQRKPNYIPPYAVQLSQYTGMRVAELSALKWECIDFDNELIHVDKAEPYDQKTHEYSIGKTKNGSYRVIPMTAEIRDLLLEVRRVEAEYGYLCEFVFADENGQIHKNAIGKCALNKSHQAGLKDGKSIHANRRTLN